MNLLTRFYFILFLFVPTILFGQTDKTKDSLILIIKTAPVEIKIDGYQRLITELQEQDPKLALSYINELKALSVESKQSKGLIFSHYQLGVYYNLQGKFDSLKIYADSCLKISKDNKENAYAAYGYHLAGTYYWQVGMYDRSIVNHLKALKIRETLKDSAGIGASLTSLSGVYFSHNQLTKAREFINRALVIADQIKDDRLNLKGLHTLANIHGIQGQYDEALKTDLRALAICAKTNNLRSFSEIYSNMALCYYYKGDLDASLDYHYKVLSIDQFFKDDKQIGDTYLNLASVYTKKKEFKKAQSLLLQAIALFKKTDHKQGLKNSYYSLSDVHKQTGDFEKAYRTYSEYNAIGSEISNENNARHIALLNVEYETEQREQKIRNLSQQSTIQKLQLEQRKVYLLIAVGLLLTLLILGYLFYEHRKLKEKTLLQDEINRQQQLAAQAVFDAEEQERRRIATELHDGVGQTLSVSLMNLNLMFQKGTLAKNEELASSTLTLLSDGYDELRSISHQMVPHSLLKKGLQSAIYDLLNKIDKQSVKTSFHAFGLDKALNIKIETALYRIIQEAVNNVLKHANATRLDVTLIKDDEGLSLTIEDDGKGFESSTLATDGIGLKNIRSRVEFFRGTIDLKSTVGRGTTIVINFPVAE